MKPELLKRLSELEARQHRATCPNGLAAFYANQANADTLFYPHEDDDRDQD